MSRLKLMTARFALLLVAAGALFAVPAGAASALVASGRLKVLFVQQNGGAPAVKGEAAKLSGYINAPETGVSCYGADENAIMSFNPFVTVAVKGSDVPETGAACLQEGRIVPGQITLRVLTVSNTAKVVQAGLITFENLSGCKYKLERMTGTQEWGSQTSGEQLTGTADLRSGSPSSCPHAPTASGITGASNATFENYTVDLAF